MSSPQPVILCGKLPEMAIAVIGGLKPEFEDNDYTCGEGISKMFPVVKPYHYVAIRLPSEGIKVEQITPNTHINLGKYGTFNTNSIIGRPFYLTYEILDKSAQANGRQLRVVKAAELHADIILEEAESDLQDGITSNPEFDEYGLPSIEKTNAATFDNPEVQKLTMAEIEALKADGAGDAKELIAKIMASHTQIDQKTAFSLAKYTLRKQKKYMKRFTVLPLDVATLTDYVMYEKDFTKIMEVRNEILGLIGSWANVHVAEELSDTDASEPQCRYLVVDDTGGLIVAALAERMGILHNTALQEPMSPSKLDDQSELTPDTQLETEDEPQPTNHTSNHSNSFLRRYKQHYHTDFASSNTLTLVHSNQQPNLSYLRYFNYDPNTPPTPSTPNPHPLFRHLKMLSWLQLIDPAADMAYTEPAARTPEELRNLKSNARSTYYRKRRRWEQCKVVVDEARAGGYNALVVASYTDPTSIVRHLIPLLTGGAQIVVYSPHIEPLLTMTDSQSTAHRASFLSLDESQREAVLGTDEFPLDPTLTMGFTVQTSRVRKWQVLPGRTHPVMTSKGGAEGYIATATRVIPVKGKVEARGRAARRPKKVVDASLAEGPDEQMALDSSDEVEAEESERKRLKVDEVDEVNLA